MNADTTEGHITLFHEGNTMQTIVAMYDDVQSLERVLMPLIDNKKMNQQDVEIICSKNKLGDTKNTAQYQNCVHSYEAKLANMLSSRGVPNDDVSLFVDGVEHGKNLLVLQVEDDTAPSMAKYLQNGDINTLDTANTAKRATGQAAAKTAKKGEQVIKVVEEELSVDKNVVETGGVRVEKRVTERPVREEVSLRKERVEVERVAVDRAATDTDLQGAFEEGTIEVTE